MIKEIAEKIYRRRRAGNSSFFKAKDPSRTQQASNQVISLDRILEFSHHYLKDKDKINLEDLNQIEKKIEEACQKVMAQNSHMFEKRRGS